MPARLISALIAFLLVLLTACGTTDGSASTI